MGGWLNIAYPAYLSDKAIVQINDLLIEGIVCARFLNLTIKDSPSYSKCPHTVHTGIILDAKRVIACNTVSLHILTLAGGDVDLVSIYDHLSFSEYSIGNLKRAAGYNKDLLQNGEFARTCRVACWSVRFAITYI